MGRNTVDQFGDQIARPWPLPVMGQALFVYIDNYNRNIRVPYVRLHHLQRVKQGGA